MSAYACEPGRGSEPGVGWNWAVQAARTHEVWVLTVSTGRQAIEKALEETPNPNLHFIYHDGPRPISHLLGRSGAFRYVHYYTWQASALSVARKLHARVGFDVAHHVTYAGFRFPSFLFALGVPYVWGPVGGSATPPLRFITTFGVHGAITQVARMCSNIFAKFDPLLWITARRARLVVAEIGRAHV